MCAVANRNAQMMDQPGDFAMNWRLSACGRHDMQITTCEGGGASDITFLIEPSPMLIQDPNLHLHGSAV